MSKIALDAEPTIAYRPSQPVHYNPPIGLIGCGGISRHHLAAYRNGGFNVVALCDISREAAEERREDFYPEADVYTDHHELLRRDDIEVVDVTTHPAVRVRLIEDALEARKHVLSQKPFVLDLDVGERLVEQAARRGVRLAVNQNGRWAPHFSFIRAAVADRVLGTTFAAHLSVHWDHTWVEGTEFEKVKHLILYDYAIHWFDIVRCFLPGRDVKQVFASTSHVPGQRIMPQLLAQVLMSMDEGQATLAFDAMVPFGAQDRTFVAGTQGTAESIGTGNQDQQVTLSTAAGTFRPTLEGTWFPDGFQGTMAELLCSIEDNREPMISGADNLRSLALCFAAVHSAETGEPVRPGDIRRLPE